MSSKTYDRANGIQAIIELQAFAGIDEPQEKATRGWDAMSDRDKLQTTLAHQAVCGGFNNPEKPDGPATR